MVKVYRIFQLLKKALHCVLRHHQTVVFWHISGFKCKLNMFFENELIIFRIYPIARISAFFPFLIKNDFKFGIWIFHDIWWLNIFIIFRNVLVTCFWKWWRTAICLVKSSPDDGSRSPCWTCVSIDDNATSVIIFSNL